MINDQLEITGWDYTSKMTMTKKNCQEKTLSGWLTPENYNDTKIKSLL